VATDPEDAAEADEPLFHAPGPSPETRTAWVVVGVALVLVTAGIAFLATRGGPSGGGVGAASVATLGGPHFGSVLCGPNSTVYYEDYFPIVSVTGGLLTSEFNLGILSATNATVAPGATAPTPSQNLPCTSASPAGWYAILLRSGTIVATYPSNDPSSGGYAWSNSSFAPATVTAGENFLIITAGDLTGSGDRLTSISLDTGGVALEGNTTFPGYSHP
jgi:hypothetical protein